MGQILTPAIDALRHITAQAIAANGVRGYSPQHGRDGGECAALLHETPVLVRYELTSAGAEVVEVSISGNVIPAVYIDAETVQQWGRDCERARVAEGWGL